MRVLTRPSKKGMSIPPLTSRRPKVPPDASNVPPKWSPGFVGSKRNAPPFDALSKFNNLPFQFAATLAELRWCIEQPHAFAAESSLIGSKSPPLQRKFALRLK
jgi:hypothetical protein